MRCDECTDLHGCDYNNGDRHLPGSAVHLCAAMTGNDNVSAIGAEINRMINDAAKEEDRKITRTPEQCRIELLEGQMVTQQIETARLEMITGRLVDVVAWLVVGLVLTSVALIRIVWLSR